MSGRIDPVWGDDVMAVADAVGVTKRPPIVHPSLRGHLSDESIGQVLDDWSNDPAVVDDHFEHPDKPIPYLPTDHDVCHGCGDLLCGCQDLCPDLARDACSHDGRAYCPGCAPRACHDCKADVDRWSYDADERGEWR